MFGNTLRTARTFVIGALSIGLISLSALPASADSSWSPVSNVTTTGTDLFDLSVVSDPSGGALMVFSSATGQTEQIMFARSTDGLNWGAPVAVGTAGSYVRNPKVVRTPSGVLVAAWQTGAPATISVARSLDNGVNWTANSTAIYLVGTDIDRPELAVSATGTITAIFHSLDAQASPNVEAMWAAQSTDAGQTWSVPYPVSQWHHSVEPGGIAASPNGQFQAVWIAEIAGQRVVQASSTVSSGPTWVAQANDLSNPGTNNFDLRFGSDEVGTLTAIWDDSAGVLRLSTSITNGNTWAAPSVLSDPARISSLAALAIGPNGSQQAVWQQFEGTDLVVMHARSSNRAATWSNPQRISERTGANIAPQIVINGNIVTSMWLHDDGVTVNIETRTSLDGGINWLPTVVLQSSVWAIGTKLVSVGAQGTGAAWMNGSVQFQNSAISVSRFASTPSASAALPDTGVASLGPIVPAASMVIAGLALVACRAELVRRRRAT